MRGDLRSAAPRRTGGEQRRKRGVGQGGQCTSPVFREFETARPCAELKITTNSSHSLFAFPGGTSWPSRRSASISSRKQPKQTRAAELVAAILEAAVQVLAKEGAHRFTAARVAEKAGVSIGSLYQYFPNKVATSDSGCRATNGASPRIAAGDPREHVGRPPPERLRSVVHAFIRSECDEADDPRRARRRGAALSRCPGGAGAKASGKRIMLAFMREALPAAPGGHPHPGRRFDQDDAQYRGQAVFGNSAMSGGDRGLRRRHGRHVVRVSRKPWTPSLRQSISRRTIALP